MEHYQFIMNLNKLYKPALNDQQIPFYNEYLKHFCEEYLEQLWDNTVRKHTKSSPPPIGELTKYGESIRIEKKLTPSQIEERRKPTDAKIFSTELGKIGLSQGWAHSYLLHCEEKGIPEQNDDTILHFQRCQENAKRAFETLSEDNQFDKSLIKFYHSMREKNAMLKEKFAYILNGTKLLATQ